MDIISISIGLAAGLVVSYIIFNLLGKTKNVSKVEFDELTAKHNETLTNLRVF